MEPMTKRPPRPRPVFNLELSDAPPPSPVPAVNAYSAAPVKVKPYNNGSRPNCEHGSMFPLVRFYETDVNENPTADVIMPNKMGARYSAARTSWHGKPMLIIKM